MIKFFKKYHKWLGVIATLFLLFFSISGIVLNHRSLLSGVDISRNLMPEENQIVNWNNAAVKGSVKLQDNKILLYGNIGIWQTDSTFTKFKDFNNGFPKGIDNRKICKLFISDKKDVYAETLLGFYKLENNRWTKIELPNNIEHIVDITQVDNELILLSRSEIIKTTDFKTFKVEYLPPPNNYDNKMGLFKTLWVIHSGEIWGSFGILFVDLIGLIFIFLSISGLIHFIKPYIKKTDKKTHFFRLNLKWHNKIGWITIVFLLITTATGMFLRPPLLIPIIQKKVGKIPLTKLDTPNAWFDNLRRIIYDKNTEQYLIATIDGIYYSDKDLQEINLFPNQPPISMMGINVFEQISKDTILVGSFNGIYKWSLQTLDYINPVPVKKMPKAKSRHSNSSDFLSGNVVTGYSPYYYKGNILFDMNVGVVKFNGERINIKMPSEIQNLPISLWNAALEVHTARIYKPIFGGAYILVVPLIGLITIFILISGFIVWYKRYKN